MADYVPKFTPGQDITLTAGAAITGGRLCAISAANTVIMTSAATAAWIGVARQDAANGAKVALTSGGVQELTASGAIAVGVNVTGHTDGKVQTVGAGTAFQVVGVSMTAAAADGDKILVKMAR